MVTPSPSWVLLRQRAAVLSSPAPGLSWWRMHEPSGPESPYVPNNNL